MRELANAERIRRFERALGAAAESEGAVYLHRRRDGGARRLMNGVRREV